MSQHIHQLPDAVLPKGALLDPRIEAASRDIVAATADARSTLNKFAAELKEATKNREGLEASLKKGDETVTVAKFGNARTAVDRLSLLHTGAQYRHKRAANVETHDPRAALTIAAALALHGNLVPLPAIVALDEAPEVAPEGQDYTLVLLDGTVKVVSSSPYVRLPEPDTFGAALHKVGVRNGDVSIQSVGATECQLALQYVPEWVPVHAFALDGSGVNAAFTPSRYNPAGPLARREVHGVTLLSRELTEDGLVVSKLGMRVIEDGPSKKLHNVQTVTYTERRPGEPVYAGNLNALAEDVAGVNSAGRIVKATALEVVPDWVTQLPKVQLKEDAGRADRFSSASTYWLAPEHVAYLEVETVALKPAEEGDDDDDDDTDVDGDASEVDASEAANRAARARARADERRDREVVSAGIAASLAPPADWAY